jgi:hypothetical protein
MALGALSLVMTLLSMFASCLNFLVLVFFV